MNSSIKVDNRISWIDAFKGMAILLVVIGHVGARDIPVGADWYWLLKIGIYSFHMPLFFAASGFVYFMKPKIFSGPVELLRFCSGKFKKFIPAYAFLGGMVFFGKYIAARFVYIDNGAFELYDFVRIFLQPALSSVSYLWFIYAIVIVYSIVAIWEYFVGRHYWLLLLLSLLVSLFGNLPTYFAIDRVMIYLVFFCSGYYFYILYRDQRLLLERLSFISLPVFLILIVWNSTFDRDANPEFALGVVAFFVFYYLATHLRGLIKSSMAYLGQQSYYIYLFNVLCIGVVKALLLKFIPWNSHNFSYVFFPSLVVSGVTMPLLINKFIVQRTAFLKSLFG